MPKKSFEKLNARQEALGKPLFANPRNAAAGSLRQLDPKIAGQRGLDIYVFNVQLAEGVTFTSHCESLEYLKRLRFKVIPYQKLSTIEEIDRQVEAINENRGELICDIDGAVIKLDNLAQRENLGATAKFPRWAAAYKYPPEIKSTVVENIVVQVGRTGVLTPKAVVRPVRLAGTTVTNATLHNQDFISQRDIRIGDTVTEVKDPCAEPLPGFQEIKPMVFSGIYPIDTADYDQLRFSMAKLQLNDAAFTYQAETSAALGFGFRCGFLGLLHMEIIQERLRREYNMDIIATYPSVIYHVYLTNGTMLEVDNPVHLPDPAEIDRIEEPLISAHIMAPNNYIGDIMNLVMQKRGICTQTDSVDGSHVMITATIPMHEILIDFHDKLKSITRGYGSMDYEHAGYRADKLVKLDILVNGEPVDAFATIVHADFAYSRGRMLAEKLANVIPPHMFQVAIQAAVGGKVIARETVRALRKNVLAKCYGGDITRKRKLLEKQKEGKKRMKQIGKVNIPQEAFVEVLKSSGE